MWLGNLSNDCKLFKFHNTHLDVFLTYYKELNVAYLYETNYTFYKNLIVKTIRSLPTVLSNKTFWPNHDFKFEHRTKCPLFKLKETCDSQESNDKVA